MTKAQSLFEHILTHYRGIFATLCLLPISAVYGAYSTIRNWISFQLKSAPAKHEARVERVVRQIKDWKTHGAEQKLCTARSGWKTMSELVPKYKLSHRKINTTFLR
jgi:delta24-sterol reductase